MPSIPPAPDGYVLDLAEILSAETEATVQTELADLEAYNSSQIVVVTIETLEDYPIESYALEIGRTWGVGQEEFNNGTIFLIAEQEREMRIEVGYGLEGAITDAQSFAIIDQVAASYFKEGDYDQGVLESVQVLDNLARGEAFDLTLVSQPDTSLNNDELLFLLVMLFFLTRGLFVTFSRSKAWWMGGIFGGLTGFILFYSLGMVILFTLLGLFLDFIASTFFFKQFKHHGAWFWGGGSDGSSGSSGGSSGGFGGFGGGGFGGGGASGRW